jgi:hypothetical protein
MSKSGIRSAIDFIIRQINFVIRHGDKITDVLHLISRNNQKPARKGKASYREAASVPKTKKEANQKSPQTSLTALRVMR